MASFNLCALYPRAFARIAPLKEFRIGVKGSPLSNEKGLILAVGLIFLAMLTVMGILALKRTGGDLKLTSGYKTGMAAFYIAEAGINHASHELGNNDGTNDFAAVSAASGPVTLFSNVSLGGGSYTVVAEPVAGSSPQRVRATSTGCFPPGAPCPSGNSNGVIVAEFEPSSSSLFTRAVFGLDTVTLPGGTDTDSYDSRLGPYDPATAGNEGDVGSNGNINITAQAPALAEIKGDIWAGGTVTMNNATATGTITENAGPPVSFPPVTPCGPPYSDGTGITTTGTYNPATGVLSGSGSTVTFAPGNYCLASASLPGGSTLSVGGPVQLYFTGKLEMPGGSVINTTADPANLGVFSSFAPADPTVTGVNLTSGSQAYMTIYAPQTKVSLPGGNHFYGAIVGKRVNATTDTKIHYDLKLGVSGSGGGGGVKLVSWKQVF